MLTYVGTKLVDAKPMSRLEYNQFRGWTLPESENGDDEGYLVEYLDGGKPNTSKYQGYVSWSPKEQFEAAYIVVGDVSDLQPHQQRVVAELEQLSDRITKLETFLAGKFFTTLPEGEQELLKMQATAMVQYQSILNTRVENFRK